MVSRGFCLLVQITLTVCVRGSVFKHSWGQLKSMMWADYRAPNLLTDAEAEFLANHYAVLSLEKCTGQSSGYTTEEGVYMTAKALKAKNPDVKVLMYWGVDMQGYQCSAKAQATIKSHPEYVLKDDNGNPVFKGSYPQLDYRREDVRDWWTSVPLSIGPDANKLIDGILADGAGPRADMLSNFTNAEKQALNNASFAVLEQMQHIFNTTNEGMVLGNGISMYPNPYQPGTPRIPDHNLGIIDYCDGIESEHLAAFESRYRNGTLNVTRVLVNLDLIDQAARKGKNVMLNEWAGPVIAPNKWPVNTPNTTEEWREALAQHFNFSAALFLTVAAPTVFFEYIEWYPIDSGVVPCPTCIAPTSWYPQVLREVGEPLGDRVTTGSILTRSFENVDVRVDLDTEEAVLAWKS